MILHYFDLLRLCDLHTLNEFGGRQGSRDADIFFMLLMPRTIETIETIHILSGGMLVGDV